MRVYLNKCRNCKKPFLSKKGGFFSRVFHIKDRRYGFKYDEVKDVPKYGYIKVACPRCGSTDTKTLAVLNVENPALIEKLNKYGSVMR